MKKKSEADNQTSRKTIQYEIREELKQNFKKEKSEADNQRSSREAEKRRSRKAEESRQTEESKKQKQSPTKNKQNPQITRICLFARASGPIATLG